MRLPLFPLQTVVFPGGRLPLRIFEQRYLEMVKRAIADDTPFGICAIREGHEVGGDAEPYAVGTLVQIVEWDMPETGIFHILTEGVSRFRIQDSHTQADGLLVGEVEILDAEAACAIPDTLQLGVEILRHIVDELGPEQFGHQPINWQRFNDAVWVGYRLAEILPIALAAKQQLLETHDSVERLTVLCNYLRQQIN